MFKKLFKKKSCTLATQTDLESHIVATQTDLESGDENINTLLSIVKEPQIVKEILNIKKSLDVYVNEVYSIEVTFKKHGKVWHGWGFVDSKRKIIETWTKILMSKDATIDGRQLSDRSLTEKNTIWNEINGERYCLLRQPNRRIIKYKDITINILSSQVC